MARIIYGSIITDIKGSIGGITFQKNGSGTIARLKPRKNQTNTQKQRDQQPRLKEVQREWNLLSLVNKILWNDFASINNKIGLDGQEKKLTGYQWFLTINENLILINESIIEVPPVYEVINPIANVNILYDQRFLYLHTNINVDNSLYMGIIYSSFILNSVSKFDFNKNRLIGISDSHPRDYVINDNQTSENKWEQYYKSSFPPNLGNNSFYLIAYLRLISKNTGISSLAYTAISKFIWDGSKYVIE